MFNPLACLGRSDSTQEKSAYCRSRNNKAAARERRLAHQVALRGTNVDVSESELHESITKDFLPVDKHPKLTGTWPKAALPAGQKPIMVLLTQGWCGACKKLKRSINDGFGVKSALKDFDVVHLEGEATRRWMEDGHTYVPQVYFYSRHGVPMESVVGGNSDYKHFFSNDDQLAEGMTQALTLEKSDVLATASNLAQLALEQDEPEDELHSSITKQFVAAPAVGPAGNWPKAVIKGGDKPTMVLLTQGWCGACKHLKRSINGGSKVKAALADFNVVHLEGEATKQWMEKGHSYVPQVYFYDHQGAPLGAVLGPDPNYKHFFSSEEVLAAGMAQALAAAAKSKDVAKEGLVKAWVSEGTQLQAGSDNAETAEEVEDPHEFHKSVTELFVAAPADGPKGTWPKAAIEVSPNKRPTMVMLTQGWCNACKNLKRSINTGTQAKEAMKHFDVIHLEGDANSKWMEEGHRYVPQVYFYNSRGLPLDSVQGPNSQYKHFFPSEGALSHAMGQALVLNSADPAELGGTNTPLVEKEAEQEPEDELHHSITQHFVTAPAVPTGSWPKATIKGGKKPTMVLLTQGWCGACKNLKRSINNGTLFKEAMKDFNVVHVEGDATKQWFENGHSYVPQVYFYNSKGAAIDSISGPNGDYKHFFPNEAALAAAMSQALAKE